MAGLDDMFRAGEKALGKENVDRIVGEIKKHADSSKPREIIGASDVDFRSTTPSPKNDSGEIGSIKKEQSPASGSRGHNKEEPIVSVPSKGASASERLLAQAIAGEYRYAMLGLILGMAAIVGGVVLCLNGVVGATSWTAKLLGLESKINDAAPGVVLFIVGLFFVWATRPKVKLDKLRG